ncbi:MAG: hypothetical protein JSS30_06985 [Verrucomicrobia bacterium]|nr:hypothetical protein [Verrucomicrobiota bacterium]
MATILNYRPIEKVVKTSSNFDAGAELRKHAWHPEMTIIEAEAALANKPVYTYVTRLREGERGFAITFVNAHGKIEHQPFTLLDTKRGIWRNCGPLHIGSLGKVICDMMRCTMLDCKPLI